MTELQQKWIMFQDTAFPKSYAGKEIDGIQLGQLDAEAAGCIHFFVTSGSLDSERIAVLTSCQKDLSRVVDRLEGEAKSYFLLLKQLSEDVLAKVQKGPAG